MFSLYSNTNPMELMMYVGNDHIDSVPLNKTKIAVPGYLGHLKRKLKEKHLTLLQEAGVPVEFLVVDLEPDRDYDSCD